MKAKRRIRHSKASGQPLDGEFIKAAMKKRKNVAAIATKRSARPGNLGRNGATLSDRLPISESTRKLEQAIRRYVDLFDFAPIGFVNFDRAGRIAEINHTAAQLLDHKRRSLIGSLFVTRVSEADQQIFHNHLRQCETSERPVETELRLKVGERSVPVLLSTRPSSSMKDGALLHQTAIVDLTERRRAENAVHQSQLRYWTLFDLVPVAVYTCDADGKIHEFNQRAVELWGRKPKTNNSKERFCGSFKIFYPDGRLMPHKKCPMARALRGEKLKPSDLEIIVERGDGARRNVIVNPMALQNDRGEVIGAINILHDITQRKEAEDELQDAKDFLEARVREQTRELRTANKELEREIQRRKGLEGKILEISDREQQRLGRELHDGLCQHLTATAFMARATALRLKNHRVIETGDIEKLAELVNDAAGNARGIARGLHRVDVDAAGLVDALQDLADRELWQTPCRLEIKPSFHIENDAAAEHLYRIAREAVINANKHANATEVVIKLERTRTGIVLSVTDNGDGLLHKQGKPRGLGFHIMDSRARAAGGSLEVESRRQGGTRVACYVPHSK